MAKRGSKRSSKKKVKRSASAPKPQGSLTSVDTATLAAELRRRQGAVGRLERRRERLLEQLQGVEAELREAGADVAAVGGLAPGRKRHQNEAKLEDALRELLTGQVMTVTDAAQAVQDAGYRTTSPNFRTIVNQTLIRGGRFKRVARGQYTAK
jgi:uncharacterized protein (UPF0335 family)